ncbi:MAG: AAA family ATPase, partial [Candidatus Omnitrophota bacterium]
MAKSYLFFGPEGVGRALTAKAFLMAVMNIDRLDHPDVIWINPGKNKKIKIEEVRKVRDVLNLKPYEAPVNACVIEEAHMMTVEASNALLKVLEEPPEQITVLGPAYRLDGRAQDTH